eukprot:CFRG4807T1
MMWYGETFLGMMFVLLSAEWWVMQAGVDGGILVFLINGLLSIVGFLTTATLVRLVMKQFSPANNFGDPKTIRHGLPLLLNEFKLKTEKLRTSLELNKPEESISGLESVDKELNQIIEYIIRDYVKDLFYMNISDDIAFLDEAAKTLKDLATTICGYTNDLDLVSFCMGPAVDVFLSHLAYYRKAFGRASVSLTSAPHMTSFKKRALFQKELIDNFFDLERFHRFLVDGTQEDEQAYLRQVSELLLFTTAPNPIFRNTVLRYVLREIMSTTVLNAVVNAIGSPDFVNTTLNYYLPSEAKTFPLFLRYIKMCNDPCELRYILRKVKMGIDNITRQLNTIKAARSGSPTYPPTSTLHQSVRALQYPIQVAHSGLMMSIYQYESSLKPSTSKPKGDKTSKTKKKSSTNVNTASPLATTTVHKLQCACTSGACACTRARAPTHASTSTFASVNKRGGTKSDLHNPPSTVSKAREPHVSRTELKQRLNQLKQAEKHCMRREQVLLRDMPNPAMPVNFSPTAYSSAKSKSSAPTTTITTMSSPSIPKQFTNEHMYSFTIDGVQSAREYSMSECYDSGSSLSNSPKQYSITGHAGMEGCTQANVGEGSERVNSGNMDLKTKARERKNKRGSSSMVLDKWKESEKKRGKSLKRELNGRVSRSLSPKKNDYCTPRTKSSVTQPNLGPAQKEVLSLPTTTEEDVVYQLSAETSRVKHNLHDCAEVPSREALSHSPPEQTLAESILPNVSRHTCESCVGVCQCVKVKMSLGAEERRRKYVLIDCLLYDPCLYSFMEFVSSDSRALAGLTFWQIAETYRLLVIDERISSSELALEAQVVMEILNNLEVPCHNQSVHTIKQLLLSDSSIDENLFAEVQAEVYNYLDISWFEKFRQSAVFAEDLPFEKTLDGAMSTVPHPLQRYELQRNSIDILMRTTANVNAESPLSQSATIVPSLSLQSTLPSMSSSISAPTSPQLLVRSQSPDDISGNVKAKMDRENDLQQPGRVIWSAEIQEINVMSISSAGSGDVVAFYVVMVTRTDPFGDISWLIDRRYSDFHDVHMLLQKCETSLPTFPPKKTLGNLRPKFLQERKRALNKYMQELLAKHYITQNEKTERALSMFLSQGLYTQEYSDVAKKLDSVRGLFSLGQTTGSVNEDTFIPNPSRGTRNTFSSERKTTTDDDEVRDEIFVILLACVEEIFDFKAGGHGLVRKRFHLLVRFIVENYFSTLINTQMSDIVSSFFGETQIASYLSSFRESFWPGGVLAPTAPTRSDEEKMDSKYEARARIMINIPADMKRIVGGHNCRAGALRVFDMMQHEVLNKRLIYALMEAFLDHLFPNMSIRDLLMANLRKCNEEI